MSPPPLKKKQLEHTLQTKNLSSLELYFSSKKVCTIATTESLEAAKQALHKYRTDWARAEESCLFPTRSSFHWTAEDQNKHATNIANSVQGWLESSHSRKDQNHMDCFLAMTPLDRCM